MLKKAICFSILATVCVLADSVKYIAHRGDYVDAPEGTAAAYRFAVERHYDIMKMDVQKTKDGVIVMSHDGTLKRTMGWDVNIKDVTYDEIKQHGPFKPVGKFTDERIVTFKEAIAIAKALPEIWIDAKHFDPEFMEEVLKQAKEAGVTEDRIMVATFSKTAIQYIQKHHPSIRRVLHVAITQDKEKNVLTTSASKSNPKVECATMDGIVDEIIAAKGRFGLYGVNIPANGGFVTADVIKKLHDAGLWISIWYVNNPQVAEKFRAAGADAFVTRGADKIRPKPAERE